MIKPALNSLVFAPKVGTKSKPRDFKSFQGWAAGFLRYWGLPSSRRIIIDNTKPSRVMRRQVIKSVGQAGCNAGTGVVGLFCHGYTTRIQLGFNRATLDDLATALYVAYGADVRVVLYACSTGSGPGPGGDRGFADELRDALCRAGAVDCRVLAHSTAGRADANPFVRSFDGNGSKVGGKGGYPLVDRKDPLWSRWVKELRKDLRWKIGTMSMEEIHRELTG